jgi:hypothetical protein
MKKTRGRKSRVRILLTKISTVLILKIYDCYNSHYANASSILGGEKSVRKYEDNLLVKRNNEDTVYFRDKTIFENIFGHQSVIWRGRGGV